MTTTTTSPSRFQHTAARRRLDYLLPIRIRPKKFQHTAARRRLEQNIKTKIVINGFNTQPPEGGWLLYGRGRAESQVSTHSRPKAAGTTVDRKDVQQICFNTQPPEGGWAVGAIPRVCVTVSTHSRPKAAGKFLF